MANHSMNEITELAANLHHRLDGERLDSRNEVGELCLRLVHAAEYLRRVEEGGGTNALTDFERVMVDHVRFAAESYAKALGIPMKLAGQGIRLMLAGGKVAELPAKFRMEGHHERCMRHIDLSCSCK